MNDFHCNIYCYCIHPMLGLGRPDNNRLVVWATQQQSLVCLVFCGQTLNLYQDLIICQEMLWNGETFSTAGNITLLQNPRGLCWNSSTVDCQRIHTHLFLPDTASTMEFSRAYGPSSTIAWTCQRGLSCFPKFRICCLQNWKRPTNALCFFLGVKDARFNNLSLL